MRDDAVEWIKDMTGEFMENNPLELIRKLGFEHTDK